MDVELLEEVRAQHPCGGVEPFGRFRRVGAEHGEVDGRVRVVGRHLAARERNEAHARIAHFLGDELREITGDLVADALRAAGFGILHKKFFQYLKIRGARIRFSL